MKGNLLRIGALIVFGLAIAVPQASAQMVVGGAEGDSELYFYEGGTPFGEMLMWDDSANMFVLTDDFVVQGTLYTTGNNIRINYDGPDQNQALYFLEGGSQTGRYLLWDDAQNRFEFNDSLMVPYNIVVGTSADVTYNLFGAGASPDSGIISSDDDILAGNVELDGLLMLSRTIYMEGDATAPADGDQVIYFAEGGVRTGESFRWDDSAHEFLLTDDLRANWFRAEGGLYFYATGVTQFRMWNNTTATNFWNDQDTDSFVFATDGPEQRYYVDYDGDTSNNINYVWYNNGGTGADRIMEIDAAGNLRIDGALSSNYVFTDLAERFVAVGSLEPGDLVQVASETPHGVVRSRAATDAVLGVVSTAPGMELGGTVFSEEALEKGWDGALAGRFQGEMESYKAVALAQTENGLAERKANLAAVQEEYLKALDTEVDLNRPGFMSPEAEFEDRLKAEALRLFFEANTVPVALSGRVPVKVSAANGAIQAGDPIAAGSQSGVGVKATKPGFIVGTALEPLAEGSDKILVFINRTWYGGSGSLAGKPSGDGGPARIAEGKTSAGEATATETTVVREVGSRVAVGTDAGALRAIGDSLVGFQPVIEAVEVGDVLVADRSYEGWMRRSEMAADAAVVGIVTETDGVVLGAGVDRIAEAGQQQFEDSFAPVAMSGIVRCKVDASYAAIGVGDLLSTSPTPGHAMRAEAATPGTILGKALESMDDGTGMIRVLVMLR